MKEIASPAFYTSNVYVINSYIFACLHKMLLIPMYPILFLHFIGHIDSYCVLLLWRLVNIIIAVYFKESFKKINDAYRLVVT